jgi:hypothetical protein
MELDLNNSRCPQCSGFTRKLEHNSDPGTAYSCLQECSKNCTYVFIVSYNNKVTIEKFLFADGKIIVNHLTKQIEFFDFCKKSFRWISLFSKYEISNITTKTAKEILQKHKSAFILK